MSTGAGLAFGQIISRNEVFHLKEKINELTRKNQELEKQLKESNDTLKKIKYILKKEGSEREVQNER